MKIKYLLVAVLFFIQCSKSKNGTKEIDLAHSHRLVLKSNKAFKIDSATSVKSHYIDIFQRDSITYLVSENRVKPSIQFYNMKEDKLSFEIKLERDGPNGVGKTRGCYVKSIDSIFVLNSAESKLFLVDKKGEVRNKWSWIRNKSNTASIDRSMPGIYSGSPAILNKEKFNMFAVPERGPTKKETYKRGKVNFAIDLKNGDVEYSVNYPDLYNNKVFGSFWTSIFRTQTHDNKTVYSFGADPFIRVTGASDSNEKYLAKSSFFSAPLPSKEPEEMSNNDVLSTKYAGIFYDKYRKVYYRVVVGGIELTKLDGKRQTEFNKPISIIILNEGYEIIGETKLPLNSFYYKMIFVAEEGLYISNFNPNNPDYNEDELSFSIFALVDEKYK